MRPLSIVATIVVVNIVTLSAAEAKDPRIVVRQLTSRLELAPAQKTWSLQGGSVLALHPLPRSRIVAVVETPGSKTTIAIWDREGGELARGALGLEGTFRSSQVFGNVIVIATTHKVVAVDLTTLRIQHELQAAGGRERDDQVYPAPAGVWVVGVKTLSYRGFSGASFTKEYPLFRVGKPRCPADDPCAEDGRERSAVVSERGDVLVLEAIAEEYSVKAVPGGKDRVFSTAATVFDDKGTALAQMSLGSVRTKWEWFWSEKSPSNPTAIPNAKGLLRRRYASGPSARAMGSHGADFLIWIDGETLRQVDRSLRTIWTREFDVGQLSGPVLSPAWVSPVLIHSHNCFNFAVLDVRGKVLHETSVMIRDLQLEREQAAEEKPPRQVRFAINQGSAGEWLLIQY